MTDKHIFWLYGRSGAGKTTLGELLQLNLTGYGADPCLFLDGDVIRKGVCSDLGYDQAARDENHRRIAHMAKLAHQQGFTVVVATIAPEHSQRDIVTSILDPLEFTWIHVDASLQTCQERDPKHLYKTKHIGDYPFEPPRTYIPYDEECIRVSTDESTVGVSISSILRQIRELDLVNLPI